MEWYFAFLLLLGTVCFAMFVGMPVALAFFAANVLGTFLFLSGDIGLVFMAIESNKAIKFTLAPIALFLLMGEILLQAGVAFKAIGAVDKMISRVPGRLSVVTIVGGTIFSSLSGSTIANTAILGSVLLPDMMKRGYQPSIAMGPIMAVGGIAMLIPPSALAVLLASLAEQSVAQLLIAGIVPGFIMAALFFAYVIGRCTINPSLAPAYVPEEDMLDEPIIVALNRGGRAIMSWTYAGRFRRPVNRLLQGVEGEQMLCRRGRGDIVHFVELKTKQTFQYGKRLTMQPPLLGEQPIFERRGADRGIPDGIQR